MKKLWRQHKISFSNAMSGLWWALTTQPNFRVHIALSLLALFLSWFTHIRSTEFIIVVFIIVLGLSAEMINTAIEAMTDLITTEWRQEAKIAKDVSAGMMLTVATGAVIAACIIFVPKLIVMFG